MTEQPDQFAEWRAMLAGEPGAGMDLNKPIPGYYRLKRRDHRGNPHFVPLAFWLDDDGMNCLEDKKVITDISHAATSWVWASPVEFEAYDAVMKGGQWPDVDEVVVGHNNAPADDSPEAIKDRLETLKRGAKALMDAGEITNKADAARVSDLANTFGEVQAKAEKLRTEEKQPFLDGGRDVDKKWAPIKDDAVVWKAALKRFLTPWLAKLESEENMRVQREKDAAAAAVKLAAEAAAKDAQLFDTTYGHAPPATPQPVIPAVTPARRVNAGTMKTATGLTDRISAEVVDWEVLLAHLHDDKDIREIAQKRANFAARAGSAMPGTRIKKERVAV